MSDMLKIDKDVPIPYARGRHSQYPFADMEVGDSFFVPTSPGRKVSASVNSWNRTHPDKPFKFTCRTVEGGTRVWRIA